MENGHKSKKAKIIVRNLPFKNLSEDTLRNLFSEYGEIEEIKLLKKSNGKLVGCGFVQFKKVTSAAKAIYYGNQKELDGRKIVIDWALPKKTYLQKVNELNTTNKSDEIKTENIDFEIDSKKSDSWKNKDDASDSETSDLDSKNIISDFNNETSIHKFENEDSDSEIETSDHNDENEGSDFEDSESEDDDDIKKKTGNTNLKIPARPSDAEDGKTVFIRNLPFSATNEDLRENFKAYGDIEYALICIDKLTEHSKGTGFVKFKTADSASACIKDSNNIYIQENPVTVTYALTKENLENKKKDKKLPKDSRNLYLVREGVVVAGSKAAVGVSASDMSKRLQLEQWKTQMLKNLNMFVSKTRLVIHNLPSSYDDSKLKQLFMKYSNPKAVIKEAKVMWEKNKFDSKGKHISKEVGFVSFDNHEDALTALRNINNNPTIFSPNKRPIVAFSIESKAAVNRKMKKIEKNKEEKMESFGDDKKMEKRRLEPTKQARQKKGKTKKLLDDANLAKLITKHRENIENASSSVKKWYEK
ncbi:RNA-binding protein, putative [Pediculus humanus corporis]|uniref:RNA-binding protein, putative n=1 Tax=Pediculus humanus subsp. corporis TaxID=121224 RepID=E0VDQ9_PEDHC|nr:RNA-binding protein, putative [Pediculus humanus corporis]EEB11515.1 RNA-binding protein, putative [Pediculus humanus corporis]